MKTIIGTLGSKFGYLGKFAFPFILLIALVMVGYSQDEFAAAGLEASRPERSVGNLDGDGGIGGPGNQSVPREKRFTAAIKVLPLTHYTKVALNRKCGSTLLASSIGRDIGGAQTCVRCAVKNEGSPDSVTDESVQPTEKSSDVKKIKANPVDIGGTGLPGSETRG